MVQKSRQCHKRHAGISSHGGSHICKIPDCLSLAFRKQKLDKKQPTNQTFSAFQSNMYYISSNLSAKASG